MALAFNRRQPPVKLAFNIGSFALSSSVGLAVFHTVGSGPMTDPSRWLAAFLGAAIANVVGVCAVAAALTVSEGAWLAQAAADARRVVGRGRHEHERGAAGGHHRHRRPAGGVAPGRASRHPLLRVPGLHRRPSAARVHGAPVRVHPHPPAHPELDSALVQLLYHSRTMFRAERAEIVIFPSEPSEAYLVTSVGDDGTTVMAPGDAAIWKPLHAYLAENAKAFC